MTSEPIELSGDRITLATAVEVREAAKAALDAGATHYTDRPGIPELREAVAVKLAGANAVAVTPADEVLITCGVQEALFLAVQVLAGAGDEVIVTGPALPADVELIRMVGATARIALADDRLGLNVEQVGKLVSEHTRLILLRSPSAVGEVIADSRLDRLGALAAEHDLRVISVESGEALTANGVEHRSIAAVGGLAPRTATINGFGGVGLDAWRVGYLAAQRELMAPMRRLKQELSICSPAVSQHAAINAIGRAAAYNAALRDLLDIRREALEFPLLQSGLDHIAPLGGVFVFVKPDSAISTLVAIERAAEAGVIVADGARSGCV
ncbi:MAG: pyridoxal phosphate-dependent aminotransferase [Solirubrobacteraceae bacterium]